MNKQQLTQLIRHIKSVRESLASLQVDLQDLAEGDPDPVVPVTDDNPTLKRIVVLAKKKVMRAEGDWVHWTDLRPAHRDRAEYSDLLWGALTQDPDLETHPALFAGPHSHRKARYNPLI